MAFALLFAGLWIAFPFWERELVPVRVHPVKFGIEFCYEITSFGAVEGVEGDGQGRSCCHVELGFPSGDWDECVVVQGRLLIYLLRSRHSCMDSSSRYEKGWEKTRTMYSLPGRPQSQDES